MSVSSKAGNSQELLIGQYRIGTPLLTQGTTSARAPSARSNSESTCTPDKGSPSRPYKKKK